MSALSTRYQDVEAGKYSRILWKTTPQSAKGYTHDCSQGAGF